MTAEFHWDDARIFLAIARAGTLSGAADKMNMGIATVSRRLDRLEQSLKVPLFSRHQSGYRLIDDGAALLARAEALGFRQVCAVVGGAEPASVALHRRCGFREAGRMRAVGWKHGRWLDALYMQRALGAGEATTPE